MKKLRKIKPVQEKKEGSPVVESQIMKALYQSVTLNNFSTHFQFAKDLGVELLKGSATPEHIEVLKENIEGIKEFIELMEDKMKG